MMIPYRLFIVVLVLGLGVLGVSSLVSVAQEKGKDDRAKGIAESPKWEYKIKLIGETDTQNEKELNALGDEGWELVGTTSHVSAVGSPMGSNPISTRVRLIFKRAKR
jgi:hypothetical protein